MYQHDAPPGDIVLVTVVVNDLPDPTKCTVCGAPRRPHMCV